jgi:hypothetical protein
MSASGAWRKVVDEDRQRCAHVRHSPQADGSTQTSGVRRSWGSPSQDLPRSGVHPVLSLPESRARRRAIRCVRRGRLRHVLRPVMGRPGLPPGISAGTAGLLLRTRFRAGDCVARGRFAEHPLLPGTGPCRSPRPITRRCRGRYGDQNSLLMHRGRRSRMLSPLRPRRHRVCKRSTVCGGGHAR